MRLHRCRHRRCSWRRAWSCSWAAVRCYLPFRCNSSIRGCSCKASAEQLRFEQALQGITFGDDYGKALQSISELSDQFQVDIGETTKQFTKLTAATSANGISIGETEKVYAGLAAANVALGGDAERLQGILLATSQYSLRESTSRRTSRGKLVKDCQAHLRCLPINEQDTSPAGQIITKGRSNGRGFCQFHNYFV